MTRREDVRFYTEYGVEVVPEDP